MIIRNSIIGLSLLTMSACATVAPEPCTPEWVEWKTDAVLSDFARGNRGEIRRLTRLAETLQSDTASPLTAFRLPGMIEDFQRLAADFETIALPEFNAAMSECGQSETLVPLFTELLRRQGVSEEILEWTVFLGAVIEPA